MKSWLIAFFLVFCDQASKFLILRLFPQIVVHNKGIAFGFLSSEWWVLINFFILIAVAYLIKRKLAAGLIISGGFSNILDRLIRGAVVDFIDLKVWPVFNLADIFICLGVGNLIAIALFKKVAKRQSIESLPKA